MLSGTGDGEFERSRRGAMSKRSKKTTDSAEPASVTTPPPSDVAASAEAAPASTAAPESAPASAEAASVAPASATPKKKKKKTKRKSVAPAANAAANGTSDAMLTPTPSTAAPPVVAVAATEPPSTKTEAAKPADDDPDHVTVPPAEDLDHDFFRASEAPPAVARAAEPIILEHETRDPRIEQLMTAEAKRRRQHFQKYVKAAVAISIVLCVAALIRVGIRRNHGEESDAAMAATSVRPTPTVVVPEPPKAKPAEPPPPPEATAAPAETAAAAVEPAASASAAPSAEPAPSASAVASAAPSAEPAPSASAAAVASAEPTELDPKAALKEKRKSQQFLEMGKVADAIEHGEQSVKLDPTDAEAWLLLGAAYQMKGDQKEARRCFRSCISEGKRGPKGECMAMPH